MLRFVRYNIRKRFFLDTSGITIALFVIMLCTLTPLRAQQSSTLFCNTQDLGKEFDYRGQSTYTKLSPGDTCKVQAILYSGNKIRIMTCSDPRFGLIQLKVFKTVREYKRIVEKIEKKESQEPIYKYDKKGKQIPLLDGWGKPLRDNMGDIQFEVASYKRIISTDTIWRIERISKEEILFDSRKGSRIYTTTIAKTEPIMIEIVVPRTTDEKLKKAKVSVGIMVGRIFKSTTFKTFD